MARMHIARRIVVMLVGATTLSACSNTAIIHYRQPFNCRFFVVASATGSAHNYQSAVSYYSIFQITKIDNSAKNATAFAFDPRKLYVRETVNGEAKTATANGISVAGSVDTAKPTTVAAHAVTGAIGRVLIAVPSDLPITATITEQSDLLYQSTGKESVLLSRDDKAQPTFLKPCTLDNIK